MQDGTDVALLKLVSNLGRLNYLFAAVFAAACVVSPQPSPPATEPDLDGDGIDLIDLGTEDLSQLLTFEAGAGTVDPADGVVIVTNLDTTDSPSVVPVRDDGSFSVALNGIPGNVVRFQVRLDDARSQPVDLQVDPTGQTGTVLADEPACLVIEPARFLSLDDAPSTKSVLLRNQCEERVRIAAPRLRRGEGPFTFSPTATTDIPAGETLIMTVRAIGDAPEIEDVLLLDILEPAPSRRAITLTVPE